MYIGPEKLKRAIINLKGFRLRKKEDMEAFANRGAKGTLTYC